MTCLSIGWENKLEKTLLRLSTTSLGQVNESRWEKEIINCQSNKEPGDTRCRTYCKPTSKGDKKPSSHALNSYQRV